MNWDKYYSSRVRSKDYESYFSKKYNTLIKSVVDYVNKDSSVIIIEEGCGIGSVTKQLLKYLPNNTYILLDKHIEMLDLAKFNLKEFDQSPIIFKQSNILDPWRSSLLESKIIVITHGVLEHFSDKHINKIINKYRKLNITQFHYVPTSGYSTPSFGDERLMPTTFWQNITGFTEHTLVDDKDLYFKIK